MAKLTATARRAAAPVIAMSFCFSLFFLASIVSLCLRLPQAAKISNPLFTVSLSLSSLSGKCKEGNFMYALKWRTLENGPFNVRQTFPTSRATIFNCSVMGRFGLMGLCFKCNLRSCLTFFVFSFFLAKILNSLYYQFGDYLYC